MTQGPLEDLRGAGTPLDRRDLGLEGPRRFFLRDEDVVVIPREGGLERRVAAVARIEAVRALRRLREATEARPEGPSEAMAASEFTDGLLRGAPARIRQAGRGPIHSFSLLLCRIFDCAPETLSQTTADYLETDIRGAHTWMVAPFLTPGILPVMGPGRGQVAVTAGLLAVGAFVIDREIKLAEKNLDLASLREILRFLPPETAFTPLPTRNPSAIIMRRAAHEAIARVSSKLKVPPFK